MPDIPQVHTCRMWKRRSRVSSANPFSFRSITISLEGLNGKTALMKEEPMEPAPPMTHTLFIPYFCFLKRFFISSSISAAKHTCRTTNHMVCNESAVN